MIRELLREVWLNQWGRWSFIVLVLLYLAAICAPFLAPYSTSEQDLKRTYHPPCGFAWDSDKGLCIKEYANVDPSQAKYEPTGNVIPIHFFTKGHEYKILWLVPTTMHLFSVHPSEKIYLLGSDSTGRDVFSRLLYGARISLSIGLIGIMITMFFGLIFGGIAGYYGGKVDSIIMRFTELLMAIPGLYLLLALRSALAQHFDSDKMYLLIICILSILGWSGTARVIRGLTLSIRQRPYVLAAEAMGQSTFSILMKHILPNTFSYLIVAATLSIPGYILGEAALSFLGIGIQEPSSSWGLMLSQAQQMKVFMLNFWWLLLPGFFIFVTVVAFNVLGDVLRDAVDPKFRLHR